MLIFILILTSLNFVLPEGNIAQAESPLLIPTKGHQGKQNAHVISPLTLATEYYPFNVTIRHLSSRSIGISWNCKDSALNDRYEVMIKPVLASYKVVETVRNNMSCYLVMDKLQPDTTYQVAVSAIAGRNRKRSGYVFFKTFKDDGSDHSDGTISDLPSPSTPNAKGPIFPRVRVVEITLVALALVLWAGAIVLFFHRWGKIRMLLPYQPDYKEMKNSNASCTTCSLTPHHQVRFPQCKIYDDIDLLSLDSRMTI
ncbi:unnamed protein product [Orchesella dallaii]|uniref:Fibronectin type-III domain-containing protein n=1 Tax=Orchesella dallaii TaxID=48710 RepID=A0ABP1Q5H7_9HEXA